MITSGARRAQVLDQLRVLFSVGGDLFTLSLTSDGRSDAPAIKLLHLEVDPGSSVEYPGGAILGDPKGKAAATYGRPSLTLTAGERATARGAVRGCDEGDRRRTRRVTAQAQRGSSTRRR